MVFLCMLLTAILVVLLLILAQLMRPQELDREIQIQILNALREILAKLDR